MAGYQALSPDDMRLFFKNKLGEPETFDFGGNIVTYYIDDVNHIITVSTPIKAPDLKGFLHKFLQEHNEYKILLGVEGKGATEQHIVTAYVSDEKTEDDRLQVTIFDSKESNPSQFFENTTKKSNPLVSFFRSRFYEPSFPLDANKEFPDTEESLFVTYHRLGTQSFFDKVSCGYHTATNILICKELLANGQELSVESILENTSNPVLEVAATLKAVAAEKAKEPDAAEKVNASFLSFLKKAWQDTVMPLANEEEREGLKFKHYFLNWPTSGSLPKKIATAALNAPLTLINFIRRPLEFVFNFASESSNYFKNRLIAWAPTSAAAQYGRSALVIAATLFQGLFKAGYLLLRPITSPITSFMAAQTIKTPWLRVLASALSAAMSIIALATLAIFVAPLGLSLIGSSAPSLLPIIHSMAYPFVQLASMVKMSLSPFAGAAASMITGTFAYTLIKKGFEKIMLGKTVQSVEREAPLSKENTIEVEKGKSPYSNPTLQRLNTETLGEEETPVNVEKIKTTEKRQANLEKGKTEDNEFEFTF